MNENELDDVLPFGESERKKIPTVKINPLIDEDKKKDIEILSHK